MQYNLNHKIFSINQAGFESTSIETFLYQYRFNDVYRDFVDAIRVKPQTVDALAKIPFLPVSLFKNHRVSTTAYNPETVFESSGTTGSVNSRHYVKHLSIYRQSFMTAFELFYGKPDDWCIIGLLPSYLERKHSSLIVMVDELIRTSGHPDSGFYLYDHEKLFHKITQLEQQQQQTLLIGVTFALLDFAEEYPTRLAYTTVMETGGMKGRRKEMTREAVHDILKDRLGVSDIHSEYGMTELFSQAYSRGDGRYHPPPWMKIMLRQEDDPLMACTEGTDSRSKTATGVINVIDLANIYSCCFIATDDMGKLYPDGSFEVLGRLDNSDIRGCSLMTALKNNVQ